MGLFFHRCLLYLNLLGPRLDGPLLTLPRGLPFALALITGFTSSDPGASTPDCGGSGSSALISSICSTISLTSSGISSGISRILSDIFLISIEFILQNSSSGTNNKLKLNPVCNISTVRLL